jgi:hypothetical protein
MAISQKVKILEFWSHNLLKLLSSELIIDNFRTFTKPSLITVKGFATEALFSGESSIEVK